MSQNSRFLLMKVWLVLKLGDLQSNICLTSITTNLDSSCSVYVKVQLATHIVFPYTKGKIKIAVNMVCLICVDLMQPLLDMGYHLYTDNWDTAVRLAEFLSSRNTNITGMVHANWKFLPAGVKQKLPKGDSTAFRKNNLLCIGWHDKKHVILLSTEG